MNYLRPLLWWLMLALLASFNLQAAQFQTPSAPLAQLLDQPQAPFTRLSPDQRHLVLLQRANFTTIEQLSQPEVKLAGLRIDAERLQPSRIKTRYTAIEIVELASQQRHQLPLPSQQVVAVKFAPNGNQLSFIALQADGAYLYRYDIAQQQLQRLSPRRLNATLGFQYQWLNDSSGLLAPLALTQVAASSNAISPAIDQTGAAKAPRRTYQNLLQSQQDELLFSQLTRSQLTYLPIEGEPSNIGKPASHYRFTISPDGNHLLSRQLEAPFSYAVKYHEFRQVVRLYQRRDNGVSSQMLGQLGSGEFRPAGEDSVRTGPRHLHWRPDQPATLVFVKALDGGDGNSEAAQRDGLYQWPAPFANNAKELLRTEWRIGDLDWGEQQQLFITEELRKQQQMRVSVVSADGLNRPKLWYQKALRDTYKAPGKLLKQRFIQQPALVDVSDGHITHYGLGASEQGYRPFVRQTELATMTSRTLWQSDPSSLEKVRYVLDLEPLRLIVSRETAEQAPSYWLLEPASNKQTLLYQQPPLAQRYQGMQRKLLQYQRQDGLALSGVLYLPAGYQPKRDGPLPVFMWAYPREYKDPKVASQFNYSAQQYQQISAKGPIPYVADGIAVFDKVAMPIVGEGAQLPNDSFRKQLVDNAQAAIDALVEIGVADPERIAIGGHSYGAFMVANLLAHSDLFRAGIARSGAYNRSLTPFGFQHEKRNYWEAPELYQQMSPFTHADKIDEPLLLIHGAMDANSGTYPMQSQRLFSAIRGLGGQARLVMLPFESHSYQAKSSVAHMMWEQEQWLRQHLLDSHQPPQVRPCPGCGSESVSK